MYLVIDTESSGLPNFKLAADDPAQPRLAHVAMIWADADGNVQEEKDFYIKPDGWVMEAEAGAVNGLTTEFLMKHGVPVADALDVYRTAIVQAERIVVAHHAQFDCKMMRGEFRRAGMDDLFLLTRNICTMRGAMGHVVKLDGKKGFPKLSDCCTHFGIVQGTAHKATEDARACLEVMKHLKALGLLPEAQVHFAKNPPQRAAVADDEPPAPIPATAFAG